MLRKILIFVLALTIAVVFTGCGKNKEEQTTLDPLNTSYNPLTSGNQSGNNQGATGATYILTTNQSKTAPALNSVTTAFVIGNEITSANQTSSTTNSYDNMSYNTTGGSITAPSVSVSSAAPTTWPTISSTTQTTVSVTQVTQTTASTTKATTAAPTTEPTTEAEPEGVYVSINDSGYSTDGRIFAAIDSEGWGGKLKSNSVRVPVYIDGVEMTEGAMLQISSSTDADGRQYVYLNLGEYEIDQGSTVTFTIPEGFLENKTSTKYNYAYEVSV